MFLYPAHVVLTSSLVSNIIFTTLRKKFRNASTHIYSFEITTVSKYHSPIREFLGTPESFRKLSSRRWHGPSTDLPVHDLQPFLLATVWVGIVATLTANRWGQAGADRAELLLVPSFKDAWLLWSREWHFILPMTKSPKEKSDFGSAGSEVKCLPSMLFWGLCHQNLARLLSVSSALSSRNMDSSYSVGFFYFQLLITWCSYVKKWLSCYQHLHQKQCLSRQLVLLNSQSGSGNFS